jgi:type II secretory ATPase GspE/PulE/Tfp pilus assembly ATPase PilB-like protein
MIGEIRDARTAATAVRAGASGQLVLATLHAKSAAEAVDTMLQYDAKPKFLASSMVGVINQRLIRSLCPACRRPVSTENSFDVSDRLKRRLADQAPQLFSPVGCDQCFSDGFVSLTILPEIMTIDQQLSAAIADQAPASKLESIAVDQGMLTLAEAAALRAYRGQTIAYEANRVVSDPTLAALASLARNAMDG